MMQPTQSGRATVVTGWLILALGIGLAAGGMWLVLLGGSWYYLLAGVLLTASGVLLAYRSTVALWVYAALVSATLVWALWEAGLDWWPLAARGDVLFLLGLWLLTPWVRRGFRERGLLGGRRVSPRTGTGVIALTTALGLFLAVAVTSWFSDPHRLEGRLPAERVAASSQLVPPGEWHAYGRTDHGLRYSPLAQITPQNVSRLEVAWHFNTGDVRGQPGDPAETTFEVTPLKVGQKLFICTPHHSVIALDATTGRQLWRYDPRLQGELALQHLTCRGVSYHPGAARAGGPVSRPGDTPDHESNAMQRENKEAGPLVGLPVAAADARITKRCTEQLFMPTADARVIALNPEDGSVCANFGRGTGQINLWENMPHVNPGSYYSTSPVAVTESLIIVGGTVLDNVSVTEPSGVIRAFDVETGDVVWAWDPGNPDLSLPLAPGQTFTPRSPNSWSIFSVDEALGLVYIPLGNQPPDQWGGNRSEAVERFSTSVVALEIATGRLRWHFQTVHHDLWDYDVPSQPSLVDLTIDGSTVPALIQPTKQGDIYVLDRRTGEPLLPVTDVPAPQGAARGDHAAPTQPVSALSYAPPKLSGADMWGATLFDQLACRIAFRQLRYEGRYTPPSEQGTLVYPGNFGVFNWGGIAVDPRRQVAFATPAYLAFVSTLIPRANDEKLYVNEKPPPGSLPALNENFGAPFAVELKPFLSVLGLPCQEPPWGFVSGADLTTGEVAWRHKNGTVRDSSPLPLPFEMGVPDLGGPIVTAGGVAFLSGTLDYFVRAYDVTDGEQLWESRLPAGGQATPMTYTGADGRQYVVVVAGGHGSLGTKAGDDVIAYALPKD